MHIATWMVLDFQDSQSRQGHRKPPSTNRPIRHLQSLTSGYHGSGRARGPQALALSVSRWRRVLSLRFPPAPRRRRVGAKPRTDSGEMPHAHPTLPSGSTLPRSSRSCRKTHTLRSSCDASMMPTIERVGGTAMMAPAGSMVALRSSRYMPTILCLSR